MRLSMPFVVLTISGASSSLAADSGPNIPTGACTIHAVGSRRCSENTAEQLCRQAALRFKMASSWRNGQLRTEVRYE
jgi:hypothetical protein